MDPACDLEITRLWSSSGIVADVRACWANSLNIRGKIFPLAPSQIHITRQQILSRKRLTLHGGNASPSYQACRVASMKRQAAWLILIHMAQPGYMCILQECDRSNPVGLNGGAEAGSPSPGKQVRCCRLSNLQVSLLFISSRVFTPLRQ